MSRRAASTFSLRPTPVDSSSSGCVLDWKDWKSPGRSEFSCEIVSVCAVHAQVKSNIVLRNFYGHKAGPYSQPRALWHPSEKYVLSNTEESGAVFVWCVASERVVETITAHDALVRDFEISAVSTGQQATLYTVSYDKLLKVWFASLVDSTFPAASS